MLDEFPRHFRKTFPDLVGRRVLVALSGGGDSVALLHLLREPSLGLDLAAAHVHHGARGAEADADAAFCETLCQRLGVPFFLLRLPPVPPGTGSREAWWRRRRYEALGELAARLGAAAVATGHQRDDVAEGVLVQLLRGGGPRAMAGIAAATGSGVVRPLLPWGRGEIREWLSRRGLEWREDATNADPRQLRARVRGSLLPALEAAAPALRGHLVRLAADLAASEAAFAGILESAGAWIEPYSPRGVPVEAVASLPPALAVRWLHAQAARAGIGPVTRRQGEALDGLLGQGRPRGIVLAGRWRLLRANGRLWLEPPSPLPAYDLELRPGEILDLPIPGWRMAARMERSGEPSVWRTTLPAGRYRVRSARPGDRLGERPLARALAPFPRHLRRAWPVVTLGDTIVWVPGIEVTGHPVGSVELEVMCP